MPTWILILICFANLATSLGGSVAIKHAVLTSSVVWGLVGAICWLGTAICMALLLQEKPLIWVALATNSLTLLASIAIAIVVFGETLSLAQGIAVCLALSALVCTATSGG